MFSKKLKKQLGKNILVVFAIIAVLFTTIAITLTIKGSRNTLTELPYLADNIKKATEHVISFSDVSGRTKITEAKIEGGYNHFIALTADGKVYGWGDNSYNQLASGDKNTKLKPIYMGIDDAIDIAAGAYFNVVLKTDGTVWTIGNNGNGQLGNGTQVDSDTFVQVLDENGVALTDIKSVAAGNTFAYAITNSNEVYAWGLNGSGQLALGDTTLRTSATKTQFVDIIQISAGENHAVAVDVNGAVWTVGYNNFGQLGIGNRTAKSVPQKILSSGGKEVAAGANNTIVLKTDGTAWGVGYNGLSSDSTRYMILASGANSRDTYFSYNSTRVYCYWTLKQMKGVNTSTNITDGNHVKAAGNTIFIASNGGGMFSTGLTNYGQTFRGSTTMYNYAVKVQTGKTIYDMAVTRSGNTGAYVDDAGRIYTVGYSAKGELGNGTTATAYGYIPYSISDYKFLINPDKLSLKVGNSQDLSFNISTGLSLLNSNLTTEIGYMSLDESVVTVDGNRVTAVGKGTTYVKLVDTKNGIYGSIKVDVTEDGETAFAKIVGGSNFFVSLKSDGTVWNWGANGNGQLGLGHTDNVVKPTKTTLTDVIDIAAGAAFSAVLKNDGTVWTTGINTYSQLGDGTTDSRTTYEKVNGLSDVVAITAENNTMHVLKSDGTVWSWGYNGYGQVGNQATSDSVVNPTKALKIPNIMQISGGGNHLVMTGADGTVWGVGYNNFGQLALGSRTNQTIPQRMVSSGVKESAAGGNHTMVLRTDGTVYAVGYNGVSSDSTRYMLLAFGSNSYDTNFSYNNTTAYCYWSWKQAKGGSTTANIVDGRHITAAGNVTYISTTSGGMYTTGTNSYGGLFRGNTTMYNYAVKAQGSREITAMAITRNSNTGAISDGDGMVYTVGLNSSGELGNGTTESLIGAICISNKKINVNKNIVDFQLPGETEKLGYNMSLSYNLLRNSVPGTNFEFTSLDENVATVDDKGNIVAVKQGTTYVQIKNTENTIYARVKINVNGKGNVAQPKVVGGGNHFVALKGDGTVWTWGYNKYGQLGLGDNENRVEPTKTNMKNVIDIACGANYTVILRKDGTVWTTGYNSNGQLGDGTTTETNTFHKVRLNDMGDYLADIVQITAENQTTHALKADGTVWSWGYNGYGQFGNSTTTSSNYPVKMLKISTVTQISGGENHLLTVLADGSSWVVGRNTYGQLGLGNATDRSIPQRMVSSGVKEVAAGSNHSVILKTNGTVYSVGYNGQSSTSPSSRYYVLGLGSTSIYDYNTNGLAYTYTLRQVTVGNASTYITESKHAMAAGNVTYITSHNGGMYTFGTNTYGAVFTGNTGLNYWSTLKQTDKNIIAMSPTRSSNSGAIVDEDGMVYTVGLNTSGEIGNGTTENLTGAVCISNKKINVSKNIINFQEAGETETISYTTGMTFNLIKDEIGAVDCTYTSLDESVAKVDDNGLVTAVGTGTTYIRLYNADNLMYATVTINVNGKGNTTYPKIVGGGNHFIALKADGTVWTWGLNNYGQLGLGDNNNRTEASKAKFQITQADGTIVEDELTDVIDVAAGYYYSLVLRKDGTVWATGYNNYGQLGNGTTDEINIFRQVKGENGVGYLNDIIQITAENETSHALSSKGQVYSWGRNTEGQFGNATKANSNYPTEMLKISNVSQISGGAYHIVMMLADSSVWVVGYNGYGQLGLGNVTTQTIPQRLLSSGAKEVATGANHTVILKTNGTTWSVGYNGQSTVSPSSRDYVLGIGNSGSYYDYSSNGLRYTYTLRQMKFGNNDTYLTDARHIFASGNVTYISSQATGMYVAGTNTYGGLFTGNTALTYWTRKVQANKTILAMASTRSSNSGAIADENGMVYTVGYNANGEMGNGTTESLTNLVCISNKKINTNKSIIDFKKAGETEKITYTTTMSFNLIQDDVPSTACTFKSLDESIATVDTDGIVTAQSVGTTYVQLYNADNSIYTSVKINVNGEDNMSQPKVVGGGNHFVALKADGTVWTWGYNKFGQLGLGDNLSRTEPTRAKYLKVAADGTETEEELTDVMDVAAGYNFTLVLRKDGTVWRSRI